MTIPEQVAILATVLITLHMVDGRPVRINPEQITQLMQPRPEGHPGKQVAEKVKCVVRLTDGTYVSVAEDCDAVRQVVEGAGKGPSSIPAR